MDIYETCRVSGCIATSVQVSRSLVSVVSLLTRMAWTVGRRLTSKAIERVGVIAGLGLPMAKSQSWSCMHFMRGGARYTDSLSGSSYRQFNTSRIYSCNLKRPPQQPATQVYKQTVAVTAGQDRTCIARSGGPLSKAIDCSSHSIWYWLTRRCPALTPNMRCATVTSIRR